MTEVATIIQYPALADTDGVVVVVVVLVVVLAIVEVVVVLDPAPGPVNLRSAKA
jgi:hypothetical protein